MARPFLSPVKKQGYSDRIYTYACAYFPRPKKYMHI